MKLTLPEPAAHEQAHSTALSKLISTEIKRDGRISFQRYMEMCLYQPGLGYYVAGAQKFGTGGDFVTAPEVSPVFGYCLANQAAEILEGLDGSGSILEIGAGSGKMAAAMLQHLLQQKCLPENYYILELGTELRTRQKETLEQQVPDLLERVVWLDSLDNLSISGLVVANELLDAMPVRSFELRSDGVFERAVTESEGEFAWDAITADKSLSSAIKGLPLDSVDRPYCSEYNPALSPWFTSVAGALEQGVVLLIDYGYEQSDYYHAQRDQGTLLCHYQHHVVTDPFYLPGLMDITSSVDFTAVAQAGTDAGLDFSGYTNQASFLIGSGLDHIFASLTGDDERQRLELSGQIKILTLPGEMGERFKVLGFSRQFGQSLSGFSFNDLSYRL